METEQESEVIFTKHKIPDSPAILAAGKNSQLLKSSHAAQLAVADEKKRIFLKLLTVAGMGMIGSFLWPKKADAYVFGSTPSANVVGVKDTSNNKINPATEETLTASIAGQAILKKTVTLTGSGPVHTPAANKKVRVYNSKFSLSANMTSVAFRFTLAGADYEKYLAPKTGGLYGANNQPNYVEGGVGEAFYCDISGTGTVQINLDYLEV